MTSENTQSPRFQAAMLAPRYWFTWILLGLLWLISWLPRRWIMKVGGWLGERQMRRSAKRRHIASVNLELCFPQLSNEERHEIMCGHFRNYGRGMLDLGLIMMASKERIEKFATVRGRGNLDEHVGKRPVILISFHTTTLDMCSSSLLADVKLVSMMKRDRNPVLNWFMYRARTRAGNAIVYMRDQSLRGIVAGLRAGRVCYIIPDEDFGHGRHTVFAPFYGQQRSTLNLVGRLAQKTGALVVPAICRLDAETGLYTTEVGTALKNFPSADEVADATAINRTLQEMLEPAPDQYLWTFRWFRTRPQGEPDPYDTPGAGI